jgi:hypothetical protein
MKVPQFAEFLSKENWLQGCNRNSPIIASNLGKHFHCLVRRNAVPVGTGLDDHVILSATTQFDCRSRSGRSGIELRKAMMRQADCRI